MTRTQQRWVRNVLSRLHDRKYLYAIEEFRQPAFHVLVHRRYENYVAQQTAALQEIAGATLPAGMNSSTPEVLCEAEGRAEAPEKVFLRVFRSLKPRAEAPEFDVQFRPFATVRSTICFEQDGPRIVAKLSDLLQDAPGEVLEALTTILLAKLYRERTPGHANKSYRSWLNSPATHQRMLQARRARGRKHLLPPRGRVHDLDALFDRLNERYFNGSLHKPTLGWSPQTSRRRLGHYDAAHDAIVISSIFDRQQVPVCSWSTCSTTRCCMSTPGTAAGRPAPGPYAGVSGG